MLLPDCGSHVFTFLSFPDAIRLRVVCPFYLDEWMKYRKTLVVKEAFPARSMFSFNTCMVCGKQGCVEQMAVPWSVVPPRALFLYCKNSYCKWHVLQSLKNTPRDFIPLSNHIFPPEINIVRSSGKIVTGRGSTNYVLPRNDTLFVHVFWTEYENMYEKWAPIGTPYVKKQLTERPHYFEYT